jgi:hypothetical protein
MVYLLNENVLAEFCQFPPNQEDKSNPVNKSSLTAEILMERPRNQVSSLGKKVVKTKTKLGKGSEEVC